MKKTNNHIEEYFLKNNENDKHLVNKELFKGDEIELRTELTDEEIVIINKLIFNNIVLKKHGLKPCFQPFITNFMRLKVSKNRQSRQEFVQINKENNTDEIINGMGNLSNILNVRK